MRLGILGPVVVVADGASVTVGSAREAYVLALLALSADRVVPVERFIDALWFDDPPQSARAQLHNIIRNLRRRLNGYDEHLIETRPLGYELKLGDHRFDLTDFRRDVERARTAREKGDHEAALAAATAALGHWRGPALAGIADDLVGTIRPSLHDERLAATVAQLEAHLALGHHQAALDTLTPLVEEYPYREYLYELRMRALVLDGRRADALDAYQQATRRLGDDLGVQPGADLRRLEREIRAGDSLAEPAADRPVVPRELPALTAALVGRTKVLDELVDRLGDERREPGEPTRIALLVGSGGVGKSALALAAAHRLGATYPDGTLFANLRGSQETPVSAHEISGRFLRSLGVAGSEIPTSEEERAARYRTALADRRVLVVLDDAANEEQIRPLIPSGSGCGLLVTSRRSLAALAPAPRWTVARLLPADATRLLVSIVGPERAGREPSAAESIAELCGFLPLAICVAGARLAANPSWRLSELEERLTDERARLDELAIGDIDVRAGIALTYESLDPACRKLFRRLGLLPMDSWPLWVAEELVGADAGRLLDQLTDVHLIEPMGRDAVDQARYRLHDLIAEFAREHAFDEEPVEERSAVLRGVVNGWLGLASIADGEVKHGRISARGLAAPTPPERAASLARDFAAAWFEVELPNLLAAFDLAHGLRDFELAGTLAMRLAGFLTLRAYDQDRERLMQTALRLAPERSGLELRIRLLGELFTAYAQRARFSELPAIAALKYESARELGDAGAQQEALLRCAWAAKNLARLTEATGFLERALAIDVPDEDPGMRKSLRLELGAVLADQGRIAEGLPLIAEGVAADRANGPSRQLGIALLAYGQVLDLAGHREEALEAFDEMAGICAANGDELGTAYCQLGRANVYIHTGRLAEASALLDAAVPVLDQHAPDPDPNPDGLHSLGNLAAAEGRWADAARFLRASADVWHHVSGTLEVVRLIAKLERVLLAAGDQPSAAECRRHWQSILTDLELDEAVLQLPPKYPASFALSG